MLRKGRIPVTDVNPHLLCVLCGGYFVDATTIIECLHSYCRTCIVRYLETSKMCPLCDVLVHKTKPLENLRADKTLQDLVYKLVPGLFESEMSNRRKFYAEHPEECEDATLEDRGEACMEKSEEVEEEKISLVLELSANGQPPSSPKAKITDKRYLLCPSGVSVGHLKKFISVKFSVPSKFQIQFYHSRVELSNNLSLHDIANLYTWRRTEPLRLFYIICQSPPKTADVITTPEGRRRRISECKARQERKLANLLDFTASESPIKIGSARSPKYFDDSDTDNAINDKCTFIRDVNENCVKRNNSDSDSSVDERPRIRWKDSPRSKKSGIFIKPRTPLNGKHKLLRFSDHFVKPKLAKLDIYSKSSRKSKHSDSQLLNDTKIVDSMKLLKIDKTCTNMLNSVKNERKVDIFDFSDDTNVRPKVVSLPKRPKERKSYTLIRPGNNIKTNDVKPKLCTDPHDFKVEFNMHMPFNKLNDVILKSVLSKTKCDPEKILIVKQEKSSHLDKQTKNCDLLKAKNSNDPDSNKSPEALKNNQIDNQCKYTTINSLKASTNTNSAKKFRIWKPHLTDEELEIEKKFTNTTAVVDKPKTIFSNIVTDAPRKTVTTTQITNKTKPPNKIIPEKDSMPKGIITHLSNDTPTTKNIQPPVSDRLQQKPIIPTSQSKSDSSTPNSKTIKSSVTKQPTTPAKQTTASNKGRKRATPKIDKSNSKAGSSIKLKTPISKQKSKQNEIKSLPIKQSSKDLDKSRYQPHGGKVSNQISVSNEIVSKSKNILPLLQTTAGSSLQSDGTNIAEMTSPTNKSDMSLSQKSPISHPMEKPEHQKRLDDEDAVMGLLELSKGTKLSEPATPPGKQPEMSWLNPKRSTLIQNKASSSDTKPVEKKLDFKNWEYLKQKCSKIKTKSLSTSSSKEVSDDPKKTESAGKTSCDALKSIAKPPKTMNAEFGATVLEKSNEAESNPGRIKANEQSKDLTNTSIQTESEVKGDLVKTVSDRTENQLNDENATLKREGGSLEKIKVDKMQTNSQINNPSVANCDVTSKNNSPVLESMKADVIVSKKGDVTGTKTDLPDVRPQINATKTLALDTANPNENVSCEKDYKLLENKGTENKKSDNVVVEPISDIDHDDKIPGTGLTTENKKIKDKAMDKNNSKTSEVENEIDFAKHSNTKSQVPQKKIQPEDEKNSKAIRNNKRSVTNIEGDKMLKKDKIMNNSVKNSDPVSKEVGNKNIDMKSTDNKNKTNSAIAMTDEEKTDIVAKIGQKTENIPTTCPLDRELEICISTEQNIYNNTGPVPSIVNNIAKRNGDIDNFSVRTKKQKAIDVIVKQINERNDSKMKTSGSGSVSSLSPNSGSISSLSPTSPTSPLSPVFRNEKRGEIVMRTKKDEVRKLMNSYKNSENSVESQTVLNTPNRVPTHNQSDKKRPADKCEMNIPKKRKLDSSIINEIVNSEQKDGQIKSKTCTSSESNLSNILDNRHKTHIPVPDTSSSESYSKVKSNNQDQGEKSALSEKNFVKQTDV